MHRVYCLTIAYLPQLEVPILQRTPIFKPTSIRKLRTQHPVQTLPIRLRQPSRPPRRRERWQIAEIKLRGDASTR